VDQKEDLDQEALVDPTTFLMRVRFAPGGPGRPNYYQEALVDPTTFLMRVRFGLPWDGKVDVTVKWIIKSQRCIKIH